jgi:large subunit ribosomal protein L2
MTLITFRPLTPSQRFTILNRRDTLTPGKEPERRLLESIHRKKGRNCHGRITSRRRGGGHKRLYRQVDFRRNKLDIPARVEAIEYDPNRSANLALICYADGDKRYILAPAGLAVGDTVLSTNQRVEEYTPGLSLPLHLVPPSTHIHAIELLPGCGAQMARGAGTSAQLMGVDGGQATLKLPSGEIRLVNANCRATIGVASNANHNKQSLGKAGRNRWKGRRPRVRGVAMNPVDHGMGGGEGRTSGGGHPVSPWGQLAKGGLTRRKAKPTNKMILIRRNGRKVKKG